MKMAEAAAGCQEKSLLLPDTLPELDLHSWISVLNSPLIHEFIKKIIHDKLALQAQ
jgi:hypothetical protein